MRQIVQCYTKIFRVNEKNIGQYVWCNKYIFVNTATCLTPLEGGH